MKKLVFDTIPLMNFLQLKQRLSLLLIATVLCQLPFLNQVFCIGADGHTAIETVQFGKCGSTPASLEKSFVMDQECATAHGHEESCQSCTDIPLDHEIISRLESDNGTLTLLSPTYCNLYEGDYNPHIRFPSATNANTALKQAAFVFHPTQILQTIILVI